MEEGHTYNIDERSLRRGFFSEVESAIHEIGLAGARRHTIIYY